MPLSASYTESSLAAWMIVELSDIAVALDWTPDTPEIQRAVNRTARTLGAEIASLSDMDALEAVASWTAWEAATAALTSRYDISTDGQSLSRSQMHAQADTRRVTARMAAMRHDPGYGVTQTTITHANDLYAYRPATTED